MARIFVNSSHTDSIKFTRAVNFDVTNETVVSISFLDEVWKVEIKSQKTRYWTFSLRIWLKSCPSNRKPVAIHGWISDREETKTQYEDDWTDPSTRPDFKLKRKMYEPGDSSVDPIYVGPNQVSQQAQLKIVFELFDENLRSSNVVHENKVVEKLFATKMYYDVTLEAIDGKVRAHKWILRMKSKYFEAMFDNELSDKNQDCFKIQEISSIVLNEILRYMYTGRVQDIEVFAYDILLWSDFFAIDDLRDMSADYVSKTLDSENVLTLMELAVNTNQDFLKQRTIAYFQQNVEQVVTSKSWLTTYKTLPSSVQEIIKLLVRK